MWDPDVLPCQSSARNESREEQNIWISVLQFASRLSLFFFKRKRFLCALFLCTFVLKSHCLSICKLTDVCVGHKVSQAITFHIKTDFNCFPVTFANILQWKSCKKCANIKVSSSFRLANKNKALCTIGRVWQRVTQTHYCTYSQKLVVVRMWTWLCLLLLILKYFSRCNTFINSAETLALKKIFLINSASCYVKNHMNNEKSVPWTFALYPSVNLCGSLLMFGTL